MKFRTKLIVLLLIVAYVSIALVSAAIYSNGRNTLGKQIRAELQQTSQIILNSINQKIYERFNDMQALISNAVLSDRDAGLEEKLEVLKSSLIRFGWYDNIYLTDSVGKIIVATDKSAVGESVAETSWFQEAQQNFMAVSDVLESRFTGKKTLVLANTLPDKDNQVFGMIFAEFSWMVIEDLLKETRPEEDVMLFSQEGRLIASKTDIREEDNLMILDLDVANEKDYISHHIHSKGHLGFKGNGWQMLVRLPKSVAYALIDQFTQFLWISVIIASVVIFLLGNFSSRRFVKPIQKLTEGVTKFGEGDLNQRIHIDSKDEIGFFAEHFNKMAASILKKTTDLLEEKGKYASILESSNEGVVLFDTENRLSATNKSFCEIFHHKMKDLNEKSANEILAFLKSSTATFVDEKGQQVADAILGDNDFETVFASEVTITKPEYKMLALYSKPVMTQENDLLGRIWVFQDVTQEREAEKSKNDFITVASHKLRTPLTAINWTIEMFTKGSLGELSEKQMEVMQQMNGYADRLQSLVKILMNAAEIQSEKVEITKTVFPMQEIFSEVYKHAQNQIQNNKLTIDFTIPSEEILKTELKADKNKIQQVLDMMLENSILYSQGTEKDTIAVGMEVDDAKKLMTVSIADNGIGISEQEKTKIFTKFFRGETALTKYTEGTGLSLYMSKIIMDSSNQKIWFESDEGKGSIFYFTVALA